jgi:hypothetical protein
MSNARVKESVCVREREKEKKSEKRRSNARVKNKMIRFRVNVVFV